MRGRFGKTKKTAKVAAPVLGLGALMTGLFMILMGGTSSVAANIPTADLTLFIHAAPVGNCTAQNMQVYDVQAEVKVKNTSSPAQSITFQSTNFTAKAHTSSGDHAVPVQVVDAGTPPFQAGQSLLAGETKTFGSTDPVDLHIAVPCDTDHGHVFVQLKLDGNPDPITDSGIFQCGTQIPLGTVGFLGLTALLGVGLLIVQRRKVRRRRFAGLEA